MRINNNIMALNAHRQLGVNQANGAKSMERLSSGLRINRAGDDAAGLAISEKMRGQIRGLKQASRNSQDAISLIQTAEGALNETHAILQRMRELATQSASDTNTAIDRGEIQKEINELTAEISRIADTTEFNTQNLLGGNFSGIFHIGANEGQNITLAINAMDANALKVSGSGEGHATYEISGAFALNAATIESLAAGEQTFSVIEINNVTMADGTTIANYGLTNEAGEVVAVSRDGEEYILLSEATKVSKLATTTPTAATITFADKVVSGDVTLTAELNGDGEVTEVTDVKGTASIDVDGLATGNYTVATFNAATHTPDADWDSDSPDFALLNDEGEVVALGTLTNFYAIGDLDLTGTDIKFDDTDVLDGVNAIMTVGAEVTVGQEFSIKADGGIDVSTQAAADKAITIINEAIETVSAERSKLGAYQNRLEHTIANLGTSAENLQAAESRIRDLDMAEEIMAFTKNNILQQAATAMLAQANMAPQSVLQLLG